MRLIFILTMTASFFLSSCKDNDMLFDKTGWNAPGDGSPCPVLREKMLNDLLNNHKLIGLTYRQIISKLGNLDNHEQTPSGIIRYEITTEYTMGDIVHIKALDLYYNRDSIVTSWKLVNYDVDL
jgi:hypothetical protein